MKSAPKPAALKGKNNHDTKKTAKQKALTPATVDHLWVPQDLTPGAKKEWHRIVRLYKACDIDVLNDLDIAMLKSYCIEVDIRDRLYAEWTQIQNCALTQEQLKETLSERADELGNYVPSGKTTSKANAVNPILAEIAKHNANIKTFAEQLALTPIGRAAFAVRRAKANMSPVEDFMADYDSEEE